MPRTPRTFSAEFGEDLDILSKARRVSFDATATPKQARRPRFTSYLAADLDTETPQKARRVSFDATLTPTHAQTPRHTFALAADLLGKLAAETCSNTCMGSPKRHKLSFELPSLDENNEAALIVTSPATSSAGSSPKKRRMEVPHLSLESLGYSFTKQIAQVAQGTIELAEHVSSGAFQCVKCFHKSKMQADAMELLKSEVELMFELGEHPNIGEAIMVFQDPCSYYLVQPYYGGGNLMALKHRAIGSGVGCTEDWWRSIFTQCLTGLAHMHGKDVMHCDIKEPNIMLRGEHLGEPELVIIDLGVAQRAGTNRSIIYGTPGYIPPEVWEGKDWYPQSDMFSLGVVVMQMLIGKMGIFTENTSTYREVKEATKLREPPFELMPIEFPCFTGLAKKLLAKDFHARPTAESMLQECWDDVVISDSNEDRASEPNAEPELRKAVLQRRHTFHSNLMKVRPIALKQVQQLVVHGPRHAHMQTVHLGVQSGLPIPVVTRQLCALPGNMGVLAHRRHSAFAT